MTISTRSKSLHKVHRKEKKSQNVSGLPFPGEKKKPNQTPSIPTEGLMEASISPWKQAYSLEELGASQSQRSVQAAETQVFTLSTCS